MTTSVVIADDHPIFRDGLHRTLDEADGFEVLAAGSSADEAISLVSIHQPDIAILDLSMPGGGINATRKIAAMANPPFIAILTVSENNSDVADALEAGAIGYIVKGVTASELTASLRSIAAGEGFVSPGLASRVLLQINREAEASKDSDVLDDLTHREEEILRRVAKGMSNREIADQLDLQEKTVKHYMTAILSKLHARNRVEAALIAHDAWGKTD
ncbi:response regulator transcription factor [Ruegeria sp. HKCCD6119]|uniref:response regulator n=1 Tax=Ruegeria sp. HKCCD6119 TaxID=2683003 RepID=UPI001490AFD3|nr:response regulator transcription factor [Ruegeria sp. HKCCD6119]NOD85015.1 response regulator [Ruegeria sp. HKCCD6119]